MNKARIVLINDTHKYGKYVSGRNGSIIVNFQWYGDRENVMENHCKLPMKISI